MGTLLRYPYEVRSEDEYFDYIQDEARPKGENVVDLMEALKRSIGNEAQATKGKKPRRPQQVRKKCYCPSAVSEPLNETLRKPRSQRRHVLASEYGTYSQASMTDKVTPLRATFLHFKLGH